MWFGVFYRKSAGQSVSASKRTACLVVDGLDEAGYIIIRGYGRGTRYEMERGEFMKVWTGFCVCRT